MTAVGTASKLAAWLAAGVMITDASSAGPRPILPVKRGSGQAGTETAACGESLQSTAELEKCWRDSKIAAPLPAIDFAIEIALVYMGHGGPHLMRLTLEEDGNLVPHYVQTPTWSARMNYLVTSVRRQDVKSVNGKPLVK